MGLDANEDIHVGATAEWTTAWGLSDAMKRSFPNLNRVATCNKNRSNIPIDGLWISPSLQIEAAGMSGFGELYPDSDHRILWVDISKISLFGFMTPGPDKRPTDSLPLRNPKAMKAYNKYVKDQFNIHQIPAKTFELERKALAGEFTPADANTYNRILSIQHDIRRRAKQKCRRFFTSQILYTDSLGIIYRRRKLWKLMELKRLHVKVDIKAIRRLMRTVQAPDAFTLSLEEIQHRLAQAVHDWKQHKQQQKDLRHAFEIKIDQQRAQKYGTSTEAQTKQRTNASSTRSIFRKIRAVMKPREHVAISTVEVSTTAGNTIECLTRESIETACEAEGQRRFTQAKESPFLNGSLLDQFGFNANPVATRLVMEGTFTPDQELRMPESIKQLPRITGTVDTEDHCKGWKKMRTNTGSSPYGPLFCDYIAGTQDHAVADVDASLSSIPYITGFSPTQWQEAADVMIPKKKTSRNVQKLRIIVLFDAMFNMVNKRIARDMIQRAQALKLLPDEVYGGVPGRRASTCSLNKILALDVIRIQKRPAAVCSNDAKSCYDRIVHTVASMCMQRLGVASETCFTIFATLQELKHHVRTAFGEKSSGYGALGIPLHGVGQGNGAGPAIWLAITIPLISMLRQAGFGMEVITPLTDEDNTISCFVYVDDVDSIHAPIQPSITPQEIAADMQRMLDTWSGGLYATGGMIEPTKSYWYLIDFKWNIRKQAWEYKSINDNPATIYLRHPGSESVPLQRKEVWDPDPDGTLGTFIAMDGNQRLVFQSLKEKVDEWAEKIRTRQLTTMEGWLSLRSGISMSLQHQIATSRLTKKQCKDITRQLKKSALKASGIPSTFPDSLVYAPRDYLGLGIPDFWHIQARLFAEQCLQFGHLTDDPTGLLLRTVIQYMRIEMEVQKCPTTYPFKLWHKCATPTQFFPFWEYASEVDLELRDGLPDTPIARSNDQFIMEALAARNFSSTQLRMLNLCRLHLRIYLLSDLTTGVGTHLDEHLLHQRQPFDHHNDFQWPTAHSPNNQYWRFWIDSVTHCFTLNHTLYPFKLQQALGPWHQGRIHAHTFFSPSMEIIFQKTPQGTYQQFQRHRHRTLRIPWYDRTTICRILPNDATPTTITGNRHRIQHTGISRIIPAPSTQETDWWGIVVSATLPIVDLIEAIRQGTAIAVTDGSYKENMGTAAFTFRASPQDPRSLTFVHMTPGMPHELTPYRAEVGGIYGIAKFITRLTTPLANISGSITIACDCKGALDRVALPYSPQPKQKDFDLLWEIHQLRTKSRILWRTHWVRGHQDATTPHQDLDYWAYLNIEMDTLAKQHWIRLDLCRPAPFSFPASTGTWSLWQSRQRLSAWTKQIADQTYYNANARAYWTEKYQHFPALDYQAICLAYKSISLYYQLRVPRWIGRRLPVGTRISAWTPNVSSECPRCGTINETHIHLISCQHPGAVALAQKWLDNLELWLVRQHTQPTLRFGVISLLRAGFQGTTWTPPYTTDPDIRETFNQQRQQGTVNVMFGWWANGWADTQHAYLLSLSRRTTGKRWLSRIIKKQWEVSWDLWKHRMKIASTSDSFSLALAHDRINLEIQTTYDQYSASDYPPLRRWFRQPVQSLLLQPLSFKQDWLTMVRCFHDPTDPHA